MSNKQKTVFFTGVMCAVLIFTLAAQGNAAEYNLLAPLPGGSAAIEDSPEGFVNYLSQLFWFLLSAAAILALVMLVVGGVQYIGSAGNTSVLGDAKSRIINALLGLVLALAAWLILYTINPDLVDFSLVIPPINTAPTGSSEPTQPPGSGPASPSSAQGTAPATSSSSPTPINEGDQPPAPPPPPPPET